MCGIAGCVGAKAADETIRMLFALQHRGQDGCGLVSSDEHNFFPEKAPFRANGLVMSTTAKLDLPGQLAIGHVRYATQGKPKRKNLQPHKAATKDGDIFFASNGDIINCRELSKKLRGLGYKFEGNNDGELITKLLAYHYDRLGDWLKAIVAAKHDLIGSYSGCLLVRDRIFLFRDPLENRPLTFACMPFGTFFASESSAVLGVIERRLDHNNVELETISGEEILEISATGQVTRHQPTTAPNHRAHCVFELIYFSSPDSDVFGLSVNDFRQQVACQLVTENHLVGDLVSAIPDSGNIAAAEIAYLTGIRFGFVLTRSHYVGRTFIEAKQESRDFSVGRKFRPMPKVIRGADIIIVDDSIVRGTTMRKLIKMIKRYKPKSINLLIASPMIFYKCYLGIDMKGNLIADRHQGDLEAIKAEIGLEEHDQLHFLSLEGLSECLRACHQDPKDWCLACFSGHYPI